VQSGKVPTNVSGDTVTTAKTPSSHQVCHWQICAQERNPALFCFHFPDHVSIIWTLCFPRCLEVITVCGSKVFWQPVWLHRHLHVTVTWTILTVWSPVKTVCRNSCHICKTCFYLRVYSCIVWFLEETPIISPLTGRQWIFTHTHTHTHIYIYIW